MAKVLIVDDDPVIQLLLRVNLEMDSYTVITADDGEQGLVMANQHLPDLVLLDVMMPKIDGLQVLKELRANKLTSAIPVILLSAKAQDIDQNSGISAGANAYITKPFDPNDLLAEVKRILSDNNTDHSNNRETL